jgi:hypothetical protein
VTLPRAGVGHVFALRADVVDSLQRNPPQPSLPEMGAAVGSKCAARIARDAAGLAQVSASGPHGRGQPQRCSALLARNMQSL